MKKEILLIKKIMLFALVATLPVLLIFWGDFFSCEVRNTWRIFILFYVLLALSIFSIYHLMKIYDKSEKMTVCIVTFLLIQICWFQRLQAITRNDLKEHGWTMMIATVEDKTFTTRTSPRLYLSRYIGEKEYPYDVGLDKEMYQNISIGDTVLVKNSITCLRNCVVYKLFPSPSQIDRAKAGWSSKKDK